MKLYQTARREPTLLGFLAFVLVGAVGYIAVAWAILAVIFFALLTVARTRGLTP